MYTADDARELTKDGYLKHLMSYPDVEDAVKIFDSFVSTSAVVCKNHFYIHTTSSYEGSQYIFNMEHREEFFNLIELYGYDVETLYNHLGDITGFKISW